jgi:lysozyme family protein
MTDDEIITAIERNEGWPAYTNRLNDLGGPTKGGITLTTLRTWRHDATLTAVDLQALEQSEARAIYQFMYVQPFAALSDEALRAYLIDLGVLRGPRAAAMLLQDIVGLQPADGWIGPKTIAALAPFRAEALVMLIGARFEHIEERIRENPTQAEDRAGWRARNASFLPRADQVRGSV